MGFQELNLKVSYDSTTDNILNDFYIPVLSNSVKYSRITGFFSSTSLAVAAKGIASLIYNGGTMRLISGAKLSKEDIEQISKGYEFRDVITNSFFRDINSVEDNIIKDHVGALGWMIQNNKLDIKIAVPSALFDLSEEQSDILERGMFHQKIGILEDINGNILSFSGSINESEMGWKYNVEEFKIFRSWVHGEGEHLNSDLNKFESFWSNNAKKIKVYDVPDAIKKKIISISPNNFNEIKFKLTKNNIEIPIKLREYQLNAVQSWLKYKKGLIGMATGTGKTFVSIAAMREILKIESKLAIVITCPFLHLIDQWEENLRKWNYNNIFSVYGSQTKWGEKIVNKIYDLNNGYKQKLIIVTTHSSFSSEKFTDLINKIRCPVMLIADEVHGLGSSTRRNGLLEKYTYRMGLSATPFRWFDEEGTDVIFNYFGDIVFELGIKDAIPQYLTPYQYNLHIVELTDSELSEYIKLTRKIAKEYYIAKDESKELQSLEFLLRKRQKIIVNAENKFNEFKNILRSIKDFDNCLIYCSPEQILQVQEILSKYNIIQHKFTAHENKNDRKKILRMFEVGDYQALVAIRCLDEGIDVPAVKTAIILASTTNPREFIQRRGRVLRKHPNKEKSIIYDILVIPTLYPNYDDYELLELERKILLKELKRIMEFSSSSENYVEILNNIYPILNSYKISLGDVVGTWS